MHKLFGKYPKYSNAIFNYSHIFSLNMLDLGLSKMFNLLKG